jgi:hypothetical protein
VIDHNTFTDIYVSPSAGYGVVVYGNGTYPALALGTAQNVFIEDNTFTRNKTAVDGNNGGRYVFRHNQVVDMRENAASIGVHGVSSWPRGFRQYEIYENTLTLTIARFLGIGITGGDGVVFNNQLHSLYTNKLYVNDPVCSGTYPLQDQIRALYFWNNTVIAGGTLTTAANDCSAFVQLNRDYFFSVLGGYTPYTYPHPLTITATGGPTNLRVLR